MAEKKMTEDELAGICAREYDQSMQIPEIQEDRMRSLNYYNQEKFGNEEEGLSSYVSSDIRDTVEWIMPQLVDIFVGGDTPVMFTAENAEDAKAAEIESRYCQYVFERQNKGVIKSYVWFKDALLQKNGIIKAYWEETVSVEREEYKDKGLNEFIALSEDAEFEVKEVSIYINEVEYSEEDFNNVLMGLSSDMAAVERVVDAAKFHIIGHRKRNVSQLRIENVPPENFVVQKDHNSIFLKDAGYCCEKIEKTRSDLMDMGYDRDLVYSLPCEQGIEDATNERAVRMRKEGGSTITGHNDTGDESRDVIYIYDHYIMADFNNDGVSEMRLVRTVGLKAEYILENEEVDRNPYHAITPYLNSHKFFGRSIADNLFDLQRAKSQLWRNAFDNVMYSSIPRKVVSGAVNMDDLMSFIPGGIIRKEPNATIENDVIPFVAESVFPMLDRLDMIRGERSGFSQNSAGLDPAALANSTNLVGMALLAQSQLLIKMIATVFAHSGFAELMLHIRELVLKYEKQERIFDLAGEYLVVDPRSWRKERGTDIKVGIGYAGKLEEIATLQTMMTMQEKAVAAQGGLEGPLTNAMGIFNTFKRISQRMGIKDVTNYFQNPEQYQAPPPSPSLAEINLKAAIEKMNNDQKQSEADRALKIKQMENDQEIKLAELTQKERLSIRQIESTESMTELELLYKYGKDAQDRHTAIMTDRKPAEKKEDKDDGQHDKSRSGEPGTEQSGL